VVLLCHLWRHQDLLPACQVDRVLGGDPLEEYGLLVEGGNHYVLDAVDVGFLDLLEDVGDVGE
jgi:hypothetical protein